MDADDNDEPRDAHPFPKLATLSAAVEGTRAAQARFAESVRDMQQDSADAEALDSSARELQRRAAELEHQMKKAAPAIRALSLLVRVVPAAGELPAGVGMKLVRAIFHEFSQAHGAEGGTRRAVASQAKVRQYQTTWEDARARGRAKGAANAETAQAHAIKPGQVQRHRREARERGAPWRGEDESEA